MNMFLFGSTVKNKIIEKENLNSLLPFFRKTDLLIYIYILVGLFGGNNTNGADCVKISKIAL